MLICGIDPGPVKSALVNWNSKKQNVVSKGIYPNDEILIYLRNSHVSGIDSLCVEMIQGMGMPVGREVFETCLFIGQIKESRKWVYPSNELALIYRKDIKMHLCGSMRAKDSNIRQALIDRFGVPGTKKNPGKLYGIKEHEWAALALAVFFADTHKD